MPVVKLNIHELIELTGLEDVGVLIETVVMIGAEFQEIEDDVLVLEFFPDRPDLFSVEGVARAIRNYMGLQAPQSYRVMEGSIEFHIDPTVRTVRPFVVGGVIRGMEMNEDTIQSLMNLQEKLHMTVGRDRKKVAIGVHDLSRVKPPFYYKAVTPESIRFVPLNHESEMNLEEILETHEKGRTYAHILKGYERYPIIMDSNDQVLSFPPIINGILTVVTEDTRDLFIDCTGWDFNALKGCLNVICTAMADRGGVVESVLLRPTIPALDWYSSEVRTPDFGVNPVRLDMVYVNRMLGTEIQVADIAHGLARMGHLVQHGTGELIVIPPPYRMDVLHPIDLVEDVAIAYGYSNFIEDLPHTVTFGTLHRFTRLEEAFRQVMIGLGFLEVTTLTLTSPEIQFETMRRQKAQAVVIENPITTEHSILRTSLLPSLLTILSRNRHRAYPQNIFEVNYVVTPESQRIHGAAVSADPRTGFTRAKSLAEAVMREIGRDMEVIESDDCAFIPGRRAGIKVKEKVIGVFGEIHPEVLERFEIGQPTVGLELDLEAIWES